MKLRINSPEVGLDGELVMSPKDKVRVSVQKRKFPSLGEEKLAVSLVNSKGKLTIICHRPVNIINQFEDKKSEAGHG